MDWSQVLTIIGMVAGATWLLHGKLSDLETAFRVHVEKDEGQFKALHARVIKLEPRVRKGR
jgi:hypothetical protein